VKIPKGFLEEYDLTHIIKKDYSFDRKVKGFLFIFLFTFYGRNLMGFNMKEPDDARTVSK
jgi:hypothetical protein